MLYLTAAEPRPINSRSEFNTSVVDFQSRIPSPLSYPGQPQKNWGQYPERFAILTFFSRYDILTGDSGWCVNGRRQGCYKYNKLISYDKTLL